MTGGSYGGGESWLQASQAQWRFPHERDDSLPVLDLQVAVPKYGWTDLGYSLAPNGHGNPYSSATGQPSSDSGDGFPLGVPKESYITGFYGLGVTDGKLEDGTRTTPNEEGPISIHAWKARVDAGDPYAPEDPTVRQIRRGLTEFRSSYYQDEGWTQQAQGRKVAIFAIQGWTDDLFPSVESFRQFKYLKALDPRWPVAVELGDVGHARAQNPASTWRRLNNQAWQFLEAHIGGSHDQATTVATQPTHCLNERDTEGNDDSARRISASTPEGLAGGTLTVNYSRPGTMTSTSGVADPNGPATDPVVSSGSRPSPGARPRTARRSGATPPTRGRSRTRPPTWVSAR